jgi:type I restriction enzyme S subunit
MKTMRNDGINFDLPSSWTKVKLSEISKIITGNTPKKAKLEYYGGNHPFFKPTELEQGYYVKASVDKLTEYGLEQARKIPAKSTLVTCIAVLGSVRYKLD